MIGPEVIFQGRRIPMSTFVEKVSGAEEYVVSLVTFSATLADCGNVLRSYTVHAQGEQYKWSRDGDNSVKVSVKTFGSHRVLD